jgi:uncharacterized protein (TIGR00661 family)
VRLSRSARAKREARFMATIVYSLAGEGRGHATRVRTIVELLRAEHRFVIFAPGDAYDMLAPLYAGSEVTVIRLPGLRFAYNERNAVSPWRTARGVLAYAVRLPNLIARLERELDRLQPDLAIADFEPALPRAAVRCGIPVVSLDHQHFLAASDFSALPGELRARAAALGKIVALYDVCHVVRILSSFCIPPLRAGQTRTVAVGPLLRPPVLAAHPEHGAHVVVYLRKFGAPRLIEALGASGRDVRVYGLGVQPRCGNVRFHAIDERRFIEDLASAHALVTTAGNQLLGEALYLEKPVLALPEPGNSEQQIHGHLLAAAGAGEWLDTERAGAAELERFLGRVEEYRAGIAGVRLNGNPAALAELRRHLPAGAAVTPGELAAARA